MSTSLGGLLVIDGLDQCQKRFVGKGWIHLIQAPLTSLSLLSIYLRVARKAKIESDKNTTRLTFGSGYFFIEFPEVPQCAQS
jgi:hypothetical protein